MLGFVTRLRQRAVSCRVLTDTEVLTMKDVQGIQRGKCNICECSEYRTPSGDGVSCEYCGHRPGEHVKMVALGQCMTKDCDCDQYQSEDPNSYSKCLYCGCTASTHQGAEASKRTIHCRTGSPSIMPALLLMDRGTRARRQLNPHTITIAIPKV